MSLTRKDFALRSSLWGLRISRVDCKNCRWSSGLHGVSRCAATRPSWLPVCVSS